MNGKINIPNQRGLCDVGICGIFQWACHISASSVAIMPLTFSSIRNLPIVAGQLT